VKLAFTLEYDGTDFSGFQRQKNAISIQECIEDALQNIVGSKITINYAGRTDAGVHALSQVFDFETEISRTSENWINGINSNLPKNIAVKNMYEVSNNFDSRFSAIDRSYSYVIYCSKKRPLFFNHCSHWVTKELDTEKMVDQLQMFKGEHNFNSFRSSSCNSNNPIKNISFVELKTFNSFIIITVTANAFLHNMVRIMIGTIIDIAKNEIELSIKEIMSKEDRKFAGKTAPAKGLFFLGPRYKDDIQINSCVSDIFDRLKQ
tara:strand:- start:2302 stop:3087 length:786 start_codon:yes stop_codon:yes gene_type:complete